MELQDEKSNGVTKPQPRVPQPKARVVPPPPSKAKDDYLGDVDLPSSSSESEDGEERHKPIYTAEEKDRTFNSMVCCLPAGRRRCCQDLEAASAAGQGHLLMSSGRKLGALLCNERTEWAPWYFSDNILL